MKTDVMQKYIAGGIMALERMEDASRHGKAVSLETLMRLIRKKKMRTPSTGKNTGFGESVPTLIMQRRCRFQLMRIMNRISIECSALARAT